MSLNLTDYQKSYYVKLGEIFDIDAVASIIAQYLAPTTIYMIDIYGSHKSVTLGSYNSIEEAYNLTHPSRPWVEGFKAVCSGNLLDPSDSLFNQGIMDHFVGPIHIVVPLDLDMRRNC
jgi:hypothetical protein